MWQWRTALTDHIFFESLPCDESSNIDAVEDPPLESPAAWSTEPLWHFCRELVVNAFHHFIGHS